MKNDLWENVTPETVPLIAQARRLSGQSKDYCPFSLPNLGVLLAQRTAETPDKDFLTFYEETGRAASYTYSEFYTAVRHLAAKMRDEFGLKAGDRAATLRTNDPYTAAIYFASWLLGVAVVPINVTEDDERIAFILDNSEAAVVFATASQQDRLPGICRSGIKQVVTAAQHGLQEYALTTDRFDACLPEPDPELSTHTEALLVYTSGTTGAPKGVVLEQSNLLADAQSITDWHQFTAADRAMCVLPIHHVNGAIVTLVTPLVFGGSIVLHRRFHARTFWQTLSQERCTWVSVVPTILAFLCETGENISHYDLSRFRHIICGAGPLTTELAHRFDAQFGIRVVHGYGLSETTCYSSFLPIDLNPHAYRYWMFEQGFPSIGCPISANEMAIHDASGNALPEGERGEITARGPNVMKYYFKRPDANRDTFAHGWFRSGDEGFYRNGEDGRPYYFITGRIKELIIRGGVNYSPFDIDEVLCAIPGVKAAMAVGFENHLYGEEVGAYVQREPDSDLTESEILRACREKLPFAKSPKVVIFGDTFPVTSTGKYQRNKLKHLFSEWKDIQFRPEERTK